MSLSRGQASFPRAGRALRALAVVAAVGAASLFTSCGGGGGSGEFAAKPMVLVQFLFVDRALQPSFPTGVQALPRNAQIIFEFSEQVDAGSVNEQTIALRAGPTFAAVPKGSFQVVGNRVIFDPTVTQQGTPNPFGFAPVTQYNVELPAQGQANDVVLNRDDDPLLTSFFTTFTTSDGFLRELDPPSIVAVRFVPAQNVLDKQVPGNAIMALDFDEPMDPSSFVLAAQTPNLATDAVDVRYSNDPQYTVNQVNGVGGRIIPGSFNWDASAKTYFFVPVFSFGDKKFVFTVQVTSKLTDLSGNALINPRSFGPFTCDGTGKVSGLILEDSFDTQTDNDSSVTSADWGFTTPGTLEGAPITTRRVWIEGAQFALNENGGQYNPIVDPLTGAQLNNFVTGVNPPTADGRRVMWAVQDTELGADGSITTVSWGPDSNATFAAQYPDVIMRLGYQKTNSLSLAATFSGNYEGSPLIIYKGAYSVQQAANVGDEHPSIGTPPYGQHAPLFNNRGYVDWPAPTSFFDWDEGTGTDGDSVLLLDISVKEGDTFQQLRGWFAVTAPNSGVLIAGFPTRRMYATYEEDVPNPASNFVAGIINPEPSWTDTAFTVTKRVSIAQSRFYTPAAADPAGNAYPAPYSSQTTFGTKSNYKAAILTPSVQSGGATVLVEYQGAFSLDALSSRTVVNVALASTPFTTNVNDCDGFPYLRWRLTLTSNLISNTVAKVQKISIPIEKLP